MNEFFVRHFRVGWRDIDPNGHVANMVYLEYAVETRIAFFDAFGFPPHEFLRRGFGPVIKSDSLEYLRELKMLEKFAVSIENGGFAADGSRFRVRNTISKDDGTIAAVVTSVGGWLDLRGRRLIEPPKIIIDAWNTLPRTGDFEELRSSIRK